VGTAAGLYGADPLVGQHTVATQEVGVLGGVDVVGHHRHRHLVAQRATQRGDEGGLAAADGTADPDPDGAARRGR
jgi:hypothetical protein